MTYMALEEGIILKWVHGCKNDFFFYKSGIMFAFFQKDFGKDVETLKELGSKITLCCYAFEIQHFFRKQ